MQGRPILAVAALALTLSAVEAQAATINVRPGPNAIQKAVDRADSGDKLRVRRGTYREDVEVDKALTIVGKKGKRPVIDGGCETSQTIDVIADGVRLDHLKVRGAGQGAPFDDYTVNMIGINSGTLNDLVLRETCDGAYYGVNVFDTGAVRITRVKASGGFVDAGIYVGGIGDVGDSPLVVAKSEVFGNNIGILIEDADPEAYIFVHDNFAHDNIHPGPGTPAGILVRRADGGRYFDNRANRNGDYGIHLLDDNGNTADNNILVGNKAFGNGDLNFFDQGSGNCGSGNSFPIGPCA